MLLIMFCVAVVLAARVLVVYRIDMRRSRAAVAGVPVVNTSAGPIEYAEAGQGVPVLSIHGAGGGWDQGLANVADVFGAGFRIIAPSRFGYLGTPMPADASVAAQADAHAALLSALELESCVVVGVSAGARSALELALRHPGRVLALVLVVPATYAPGSPVAIEGSRGSAWAFRWVNAGADFFWWVAGKIAPSMLVRFLGVPPALLGTAVPMERARVLAIVRSVHPLARRVRGIKLDSLPDLARPPMERINVPTLLVSSRDDLFNTFPAAAFAARTIPAAELAVYDSGGHLLVGHGKDLRQLVQGFLARIPGGPGSR